MHGIDAWLLAAGGVVFWICVLGIVGAVVMLAMAAVEAVIARRDTRRVPRAVGSFVRTARHAAGAGTLFLVGVDSIAPDLPEPDERGRVSNVERRRDVHG